MGSAHGAPPVEGHGGDNEEGTDGLRGVHKQVPGAPPVVRVQLRRHVRVVLHPSDQIQRAHTHTEPCNKTLSN